MPAVPDALLLYPAATHVARRGKAASFDLEGRWLTFFEDGVLYKRALDGRVHLRWREGGRRHRRVIEAEAAAPVHARVRALAEVAWSGAEGEARRRLRAILAWDPARLIAEKARFYAVYKPIAILPPDRYLSVVLQATEGCTWNKCTFCSFYADRPFSAKPPEAFAAHARAVRDFLGKNALLRKDIFLADGNALALSEGRLLTVLERTRVAFPRRPVFGFIDLFTGERHPLSTWRRLREAGLKGVYLGMETGHDPLLAWLNKPGSQRELLAFVADLKAAGLFVGLIVMVGVGGRAFQERHFRDTLEALAAMPLDKGDVVFLSPFVEDPASAYHARRQAEGVPAMSEAEVEAELKRFAHAVRGLGLRAARYDIREFLY